MLEIEEEDRLDFQDILDIVTDLENPARPSLNMLNSNGSQRNMELSRGNRPGMNYARTPKQPEKGKYRNDVSPFRGRFGAPVKSPPGLNSRRTPDRAHESRSPMRRQNKPQPQNNFGVRQDFSSMPRTSPIPRRWSYQLTQNTNILSVKQKSQ